MSKPAPYVASVVIPTYNRADSLQRVLDALRAQHFDLDAVEIVVVVDGSTDGTLALLAAQPSGLQLRVVEQAQNGVAVARNRGAAAASAPLLIFIDDDVLPGPGFLAAHVGLQSDGDCVGLGRLTPPADARPPAWSRWLAWQLEKQYAAMLAGERAIDGRALYSGNFAVPRAAFEAVGGFDETQTVCEDTDLGVRLQRSGVRFRLCPGAIGYHGGFHDYAAWQRTAHRDGLWDAALALKLSYPYGWQELLDDFDKRNRIVQALAKALLDRRPAFGLSIGALRAVATLAGGLRLDAAQLYVYSGIYNLLYWQGVCDGLGGADLLRRYLRTGPVLEAAR